jgi:hypothetical protein
MAQLELDYPTVKFVYMTGHTDGYQGWSALRANNDSIKQFCNLNNKILYDFEDIESWDPDGNYYGDKHVTGGCNWDANGSGVTEETAEETTGETDYPVDPADGWWPPRPLNGDRNWALEWQAAHLGEWYACSIRDWHTQHLNHNLKAYAFWWLMARLSGWDGNVTEAIDHFNSGSLSIFPNPADAVLIIESEANTVQLIEIYTLSGVKVMQQKINMARQLIDISQIPSGMYLYKIHGTNNISKYGKLVINR